MFFSQVLQELGHVAGGLAKQLQHEPAFVAIVRKAGQGDGGLAQGFGGVQGFEVFDVEVERLQRGLGVAAGLGIEQQLVEFDEGGADGV